MCKRKKENLNFNFGFTYYATLLKMMKLLETSIKPYQKKLCYLSWMSLGLLLVFKVLRICIIFHYHRLLVFIWPTTMNSWYWFHNLWSSSQKYLWKNLIIKVFSIPLNQNILKLWTIISNFWFIEFLFSLKAHEVITNFIFNFLWSWRLG